MLYRNLSHRIPSLTKSVQRLFLFIMRLRKLGVWKTAMALWLLFLHEMLEAASLKDLPSRSLRVRSAVQRSIAGTSVNITQNPPSLTYIGEKRIVARSQEDVELFCPMNCEPPCSFDWKKSNETITQWDRFNFLTGNKLQLQILSLRPEDSGTYECKGVNGFGSETGKFRLIVKGEDLSQSNLIKRTPSHGILPEIVVKYLPTEAVVPLRDGDDLSLHCEATGYPSPNVTWYKNNLCLSESRDNNVFVLKLTNVSEKDSGSYRCEAQNEIGKSIYSLEIKVSGGSTPYYGSAEVLSLTPTNLTLLPGESGSFTCIVRSDAIPFLRWVKRLENPAEAEMNVYNYNGELLEILNRTDVIHKSGNTYSTKLVFRNVTKERGGTYACVIVGPVHNGEFNHLATNLFVLTDGRKTQNGVQKAAQVQYTLLLTFCFIILSVLTIVCFYRLYGCRRKPKHPIPTMRLTSQTSNGVTRVPIPSKSPGETVTTTITNQNGEYSPFLSEEAVITPYFQHRNQNENLSSQQSRDVSIGFYSPSPKWKKSSRHNRRTEFNVSDSSSQSDSVYFLDSKFRRNARRGGYTHLHHDKRSAEEFRLHRVPLTHSSYMDPPCTPVTAYSVNSGR